MRGQGSQPGHGPRHGDRWATRLVMFDIGRWLEPFVPPWLAQVMLAVTCTALALGLRTLIDSVAPGVGPYSPIYPAVLIAGLFGGGGVALIVLMLTVVYVWLVVLPAQDWGGLAAVEQYMRLGVVLLISVIIILLADIFRRAAHQALADRDRRIEEMNLFLHEFEHRVKNNFTSVAALIDLQRKRATDPAVAAALAESLHRVASMARAHLHLYHDGGGIVAVDTRRYLGGLVEALAEGPVLPAGVTLSCEAASVDINRDRALAIGLLVNELVTNAAKHAFVGRETGTITVRLEHLGASLRLSVADDGIGMQRAHREGGLGQRLIEAFVRQAQGKIKSESSAAGSRFVVEMPLRNG